MGSKGSPTVQNSVQTYMANPTIAGAGTAAIDMAKNAAAQGFQTPVAPVAAWDPAQNRAYGQYLALQGKTQPYMDQSAAYWNQSAAPISYADINRYYSPAVQGVTNELKNIYGMQQSQNAGTLTQSAGGVGADRIAVGQANLAHQQDLAAGQTYANLWQNATSAAQADRAAKAAAASGFAGLGTQNLNANLSETNALATAGLSAQQQAQAQLNAPYQNQLARIAFPYQQAQFLAGITGNLAPALGGTTSGTQTTNPAQPSWLNQALGIGTAAAGIAGSLGGFGGGGSGSASQANPMWYGAQYDSGGNFVPSAFTNTNFASGGSVDGEDGPEVPGISDKRGLSPIPYIPNTPAPVQHPSLQFSSPSGSGGDSTAQTVGDIAKIAANVLPMFLKDGGGVYRMADGGLADNDPDSPDFDVSRPITGKQPSIGWPWPFNTEHTEAGGHGELIPNQMPISGLVPSRSDYTESPIHGIVPRMLFGRGQTAAATPAIPSATVPAQPTEDVPPVTGALPDRVPLPMARPSPALPAVQSRQPNQVTALQSGRGSPSISIQSGNDEDMGHIPYPDATKKNWGERMESSPWMALVKAGAAMASTTGPVGTAIGKGLAAGADTLSAQRKELRTDEQINQRAQQLYQTAKAQLDKYTKMTPYERASVAARNREIDQEGQTGITGPKLTAQVISKAYADVRALPENAGKTDAEILPQVRARVLALRQMLGAAPLGEGSSSETAIPDPGEGKREVGKWYIGPTGKPQQWTGTGG